MKYISNLRYLLFLGLIGLSSIAIGQIRLTKDQVRENMWGEDDPAKSLMEIPEKWKEESAVVLYQNFEFSYENRRKSVDYIESLRKRVKLLDKSAIDQFSEFSFDEKFRVRKGTYGKLGTLYSGFKIVKPDGTEKVISLDDAVELDAQDKSQKKIAIPGLELGDIIDFYFYAHEPFVSKNSYEFDPVITQLGGSYPIMEQQISYMVAEDFFVNYKLLHGAPKLEKKGLSKTGLVLYTLTDKDRDKVEDLRWFYPNRELPTIKFQVVFKRYAVAPNISAFLDPLAQVKNKVTDEEVWKYYSERIGFKMKVKDLEKHLSKKGLLANGRQDEMMEEAYYYLRYQNLVKVYEPIVFYQEGYISISVLALYNLLNNEQFISLYGSFLQKRGIAFEVIAAIPRSLGGLDELVIEDEITLMIRLKNDDTYISTFDLNQNFGVLPPAFEATEALVMDFNSKNGEKHKREFLPFSSKEVNKKTQITRLKLGEEMKKLYVTRENFQVGHIKSSDQDNMLEYYDILEEDNARYQGKPYIEVAPLTKKARAQVRKKYTEKQQKDREEQLDYFKRDAEDELDAKISDYKGFNISSTGRYGDLPSFDYTEEFEIEKELLSQAGQNYLLDIGRFIGGQVALKPDEMERKYHVYMPYARSYDNEIILEIPEGYTVKGLDKLTLEVENKTGGFVSSAKIEEGLLKIKASKYYNNNVESPENWPLMVEFLEAAYQFTQEKVLLKKEVN